MTPENKIISRKEAKSKGLKHYFTWKSCKRGHVAKRLTSTFACVECQAVYRIENKDNILIANKRWRDGNKDKCKSIKKRWEEKNPNYHKDYKRKNKDRMKVLYREWQRNNPERVSERNKRWRDKNKGKIKEYANRRRALFRNAEGSHTSSDIYRILSEQGFECVYCGDCIKDSYHVDHIMPLSLGGSNWPSNLQCLCERCNLMKSCKHPDDWHKEIGYHS